MWITRKKSGAPGGFLPRAARATRRRSHSVRAWVTLMHLFYKEQCWFTAWTKAWSSPESMVLDCMTPREKWGMEATTTAFLIISRKVAKSSKISSHLVTVCTGKGQKVASTSVMVYIKWNYNFYKICVYLLLFVILACFLVDYFSLFVGVCVVD